MFEGITPIVRMGDVWIKREDLACWSSLDYPSGSKVRQYLSMTDPGEYGYGFQKPKPCIVGCSANSAMQIYVSATARITGSQGIVYTAARKKRSDATKYAAEMGAEIVEVKPGYLSLIRSRARARAMELGETVRWSPNLAIEDTIKQCCGIPTGVKRIIVPTGSGLTAAGIIAGISAPDLWFDVIPKVVIVCTSGMAELSTILSRAKKAANWQLGEVEFIPATVSYNTHEVVQLPDGTPLDPYYAAKAWKYMKPGDLFWPPGLRPVRAMPVDCQEQFKNWKGPKE